MNLINIRHLSTTIWENLLNYSLPRWDIRALQIVLHSFKRYFLRYTTQHRLELLRKQFITSSWIVNFKDSKHSKLLCRISNETFPYFLVSPSSSQIKTSKPIELKEQEPFAGSVAHALSGYQHSSERMHGSITLPPN